MVYGAAYMSYIAIYTNGFCANNLLTNISYAYAFKHADKSEQRGRNPLYDKVTIKVVAYTHINMAHIVSTGLPGFGYILSRLGMIR